MPVKEVIKQQYTSCMKVGTGGNLDLSREYHKKLFGPLFYSWWNYPLKKVNSITDVLGISPIQYGCLDL